MLFLVYHFDMKKKKEKDWLTKRTKFGYNSLGIFLLDVNFDKFTIGLHFLLINLHACKISRKSKFSVVMTSIKCLKFKLF